MDDTDYDNAKDIIINMKIRSNDPFYKIFEYFDREKYREIPTNTSIVRKIIEEFYSENNPYSITLEEATYESLVSILKTPYAVNEGWTSVRSIIEGLIINKLKNIKYSVINYDVIESLDNVQKQLAFSLRNDIMENHSKEALTFREVKYTLSHLNSIFEKSIPSMTIKDTKRILEYWTNMRYINKIREDLSDIFVIKIYD